MQARFFNLARAGKAGSTGGSRVLPVLRAIPPPPPILPREIGNLAYFVPPPAVGGYCAMLTWPGLPVAWLLAALVKICVSESLLLTRYSIVRAWVVVG